MTVNDAPLSLSFLDTAVHPGDLGQLGAYRILALIGQGGMGVVLKAVDPALERQVAVKVMRPELAADPVHRERFLREARAVAAIQHDGVVAIHQVGEHGGLPFLVMPLLQGESLETRLRRECPLPYAEVLRIGREAAEGLAAAHARGLLHRDIKPDNLWLDLDQGKVRLLDFGLARPLEGDLGAPSPGGVVGTAHYMAPEQARGEPLDARADLFSLGCTLYRMSTGRLPFPGDNLFAILTNLATTEPPPPHELNSRLPRDFSDLVLCLLSKDREQRTASAREVMVALQRLEKPAEPAPLQQPHRRRLVSGLLLVLVGSAFGLSGDAGPGADSFADRAVDLPVEGDVTPDSPVFTVPDCHFATFGPGARHIITSGARLLPRRVPGFLGIFDAALGKRLARAGQGTTDALVALAAPDGTRIYQGGRVEAADHSPGFVHVWDWDGDALRFNQALEHNLKAVVTLALSPDGKLLAAGGQSTTVKVWRTNFLRKAFRVDHLNHVQHLAFSPDGDFLASACNDGTAWIWNGKGLQIALLRGHQGVVRAVLWSGDGRALFTAGDDRLIRRWDLTRSPSTSTVVATSPEAISSLVFSPNGRYLVSGDFVSDDRLVAGVFGRVRFWSLDAGKQLASFAAHDGGRVTGLAFSDNGKRLLTSGWPECVGKVWRTPSWLLASHQGGFTP